MYGVTLTGADNTGAGFVGTVGVDVPIDSQKRTFFCPIGRVAGQSGPDVLGIDLAALVVTGGGMAMTGITNKPVANAEEDKGIFRSPDGSPTGVIRELSMEVIERAVLPILTEKEKLDLLKAGQNFLNSFGITTTINATGDLAEIELYGKLRDRNELTVRRRRLAPRMPPVPVGR